MLPRSTACHVDATNVLKLKLHSGAVIDVESTQASSTRACLCNFTQ